MVEADNVLAPVPAPLAEIAPEGTAQFDEFFSSHYTALMRFAMYLGAGEAEAEDAVVQTMAEMYQRWAKIRHPVPYAKRALRSNVSKSAQKRRRELDAGGQLAEAAESAAGELMLWESGEHVEQLLGALSEDQRMIMRETLEGLRPSEIAEMLGRTPASVRKTLQRARANLKPLVDRNETATMPDSGRDRTERLSREH